MYHITYIKTCKINFSAMFDLICSSEPVLRRGDPVYLVGLNSTHQVTSRKSIITNACDALDVRLAESPRYRATNSELIELDTG